MNRRFSSNREHLGTLAELNVTPLLDLAFVLLIIFMITAPMLRRGIDLETPSAKSAAEITAPGDLATLSMDGGGRLFLNGAPLERAGLSQAVADLRSARPDLAVLLEAHRDLPVQTLVDLMNDVRSAGVQRIGLATREEEANP